MNLRLYSTRKPMTTNDDELNSTKSERKMESKHKWNMLLLIIVNNKKFYDFLLHSTFRRSTSCPKILALECHILSSNDFWYIFLLFARIIQIIQHNEFIELLLLFFLLLLVLSTFSYGSLAIKKI